MTKQEALNKIKELEDYIKELDDNDVGFKDDEIFLLSAEEYEMYKDEIPHINTYWWLRSHGYNAKYPANIDVSGSVDNFGHSVENVYVGIRPVVKYKDLKVSYKNKDKIIVNGFPFIIIDEENKIAIAEVPINFDRFGNDANDYETSYVRRWLLDWLDEYKK